MRCIAVGNLVLRHSVPHFPTNSGGIAYWVAEPRFTLTPKLRKWKYWILHSGNRTHNQSRHTLCPCVQKKKKDLTPSRSFLIFFYGNKLILRFICRRRNISFIMMIHFPPRKNWDQQSLCVTRNTCVSSLYRHSRVYAPLDFVAWDYILNPYVT